MDIPERALSEILDNTIGIPLDNDSFYMITVFDCSHRPHHRIGVHRAGIFKHFIQANYAVQRSVGLPGVNREYAVIEQYHYGLVFDIHSKVIESWWYVWKPNRQQFEFIDYTPDEFKPGGRLHRKSYGV